jgi:hypothetical protein
MPASFVTLRAMALENLLMACLPQQQYETCTTQPRTLLPTYDEVVNITGLL